MPSEILATIKEVGKIAKDVVEKTSEMGLEKGKQIVEKIKDFSESSLSEIMDKSIENIKNAGDGVMTKLDDIKNLTPEQLKEKMNQSLEQGKDNLKETEIDENVKEGLTDEEKAKIKEETQATIRCIPFGYEQTEGVDMVSGKPAKCRVIMARSY